jgi:hypothetical protein
VIKDQSQKAGFTILQYPLKNSAVFDSASTIHIFNQLSRFLRFVPAPPGDFVWAGDSQVPVLGYGDVDIEIEGPEGTSIMRLFDVAYCEGFACNLVSFRKLKQKGYYWDNRPGHNELKRDGEIIAYLRDHYDQFVLEYIPENLDRAAFHTRRNKFNSWTERKPVTADAMTWHLRLGHPGPQTLEHLVNSTEGVRIRGPTTVECEACGLTKASRQIHRERRDRGEEPGERISIDFHDFEESGQGKFTRLLLITDRWSGYMWDYYLTSKKAKAIKRALEHLFNYLHNQYKIRPKAVECDGEITQSGMLKRFFEKRSVKIEPSPPNTQSQNGGAERSGGVVKEKMSSMRSAARLPDSLWPELSKAAVYLLNRLPRYLVNWKTPYDRFHTYLAHRDGVVVKARRPNETHLKIYGCKAYALTAAAQLKQKRLKRFDPKAWIGYLVGYDSSNVYRIWNPALNKVVSTRDVIFDETSTFSGNVMGLQDDFLQVNLDELADLLTWVATRGETTGDQQMLDDVQTEEEEEDETTDDETMDDESEILRFNEAGEDDDVFVLPRIELGTPVPEDPMEEDSGPEPTTSKLGHLPTPGNTPPAALLAATINQPNDDDLGRSEEYLETWRAAFLAGRQASVVGTVDSKFVDKAQVQRLRRQPGSLNRLCNGSSPG